MLKISCRMLLETPSNSLKILGNGLHEVLRNEFLGAFSRIWITMGFLLTFLYSPTQNFSFIDLMIDQLLRNIQVSVIIG